MCVSGQELGNAGRRKLLEEGRGAGARLAWQRLSGNGFDRLLRKLKRHGFHGDPLEALDIFRVSVIVPRFS